MFGRQFFYKELELVFSLHTAWCKQILYQFKYRHNMPLLGRRKLGNQQNDRSHQTFGRIIKECVLTVRCRITITEYQSLSNYFCIFFGFCFQRYVFGMGLILVHILVYEMQKIVAV